MTRFTMMLVAALALPVGAQAADAFKVDSVHSQVLFTTTYFGHSNFTGRFNGFSGTVTEGESAEWEIDITSVDTNMAKRDGHLQSPDFFNAKQFPKATFKSKAWTSTGADAWDVKGDFTLRGKTQEVVVKVTKIGAGKDPKGNDRIGYDAVFTIDRHQYGIDYGKGGLGANVEIRIQTSTVKG